MAVQPVLERLIVVVVVVALILISFDIKAKANGQFSNLSVGNFLSPEADVTSWLSPSGVFAFGFYRQIYGFAVGIWMNNEDKKTVVWTAIRDGPPISSDATLKLTEEGLFLFQTENNNQTLISSSPRYPGKVSSAAMLDSGNFVLNGNDLGVIWESFDFPTDTILGGQTLFSNSPLVSSSSPSNHSSGRYLLIMQGDGNLVSYAIHGSRYREEDSYWSTSTWGTQFSMLCLNETGSLFLKDDEDRVWIVANGSSFSTTARSINNSEIIIYRATLDHDANFRLYSHQIYNHKSRMLLLWQAVDNQRGVLSKGSCGLNSYYVVDGSSSYCSCYPGFAFINPKNRQEGCFQQYIEDSCMDQDEDQGTRYNMSTPLENTIWDDRPYLVVQLPEKDACSKSCLEDCNCKAVLYASPNCKKYRLPLRYGKKGRTMSTTAFIKMVRETNINGSSNHTPAVNSSSLFLALSLGVVGLSFVFAISSFVVYKYRDHRYKKLLENAILGLDEDFGVQSFSYDELEKATDGFKEELGRGAFGAVYKGTLSRNGRAIAVKRLEKVAEEGVREFEAEMTAITRTYHRNLVQLLGFCIEGSRKLLVYEFMSNGSLADLLFKAATSRPTWRERVKFVLDVARGVLYLHQECGVHIILCNLKAQNIMLDDTWTAKISDFGLAALVKPNPENMSMNTEGSIGYLAPEWQKKSHLSVKADIYSFGVVLLETVCCRSIEVSEHLSPDEILLSNWVYNCFIAGELEKLVEEDGDRDVDVDKRTLERMVKVGLWCIQDDPALRPVMKDVILMLEGTMDIPIPPPPGFPAAP